MITELLIGMSPKQAEIARDTIPVGASMLARGSRRKVLG
jgi:hypothetical protein